MKGAESVGPPCVASVLKPHPQVVCGTPPRIYLSQHVGLYFARSLAKVEKFGIKMQLDCWQMIEFVDLNQVCGCECCCLCSCRCVMCLTSSGDMPGGRRKPILAVTWQQKTKRQKVTQRYVHRDTDAWRGQGPQNQTRVPRSDRKSMPCSMANRESMALPRGVSCR